MNLKSKLFLKKLLKWPNKNNIILIFTMLHFWKKYKEKHLQISLLKSWWYDLQFLKYRAKNTEIGNFRSFFVLLPSKNLKNQDFKNFTHVYQKSQSYDVWDMECDRQNFLSLWTVFLLFYPPMDPENQNFEKMKKALEGIIILQMFTINGSHMIYGFQIWSATDKIFWSFWTAFCPFTH